ncbi:MAG: hypothetical protein N0E58_15875 [Candidatus Thiodiazotropha endolucinida]|uniref:Uncharacterized protein n=1 Tax=Candidatus Thiodiazotropha taylori TaxID=2792791 RepID=A0A9E4NMU8_9GAMM|nr:hypothetical protein [Candidatus Thiodiazotropha taylori]MCW4237726.1 hypothetical protein [Candidatus Thiodiazotropha endolucinida]
MSEQEEGQGLDLGIDGREREQEFKRLEAEAISGGVSPSNPVTAGPVEPDTAEIIESILQMGFGILTPNWGVTPGECKELSKSYGALFDKYFPGGMAGKYGLELTAVMGTAAVVLPRINKPRKLEPQPEQQPVGGSGNE